MKNSIRLPPEHGLNPALAICFYCGEERGDAAFFGNAYNGEAPMRVVVDTIPCDKCKEKYADYTLLIENTGDHKHFQPTGRWCAVKPECLKIPYAPVAFINTQAMDMLISKLSEDERSTVSVTKLKGKL